MSVNENVSTPAPLTAATLAKLEDWTEHMKRTPGWMECGEVLAALLAEIPVGRHALQGYRAHEGRLDDQRTDVDNLRGVVADLFEAHAALLRRVERLERERENFTDGMEPLPSRPALVHDWQGC